MIRQAYLLDTNVVIGLEDNKAVEPALASFSKLTAKHKVDVFIHEVARDDIRRDRDAQRRTVSLSKIEKFQALARVRDLSRDALEAQFGPLRKENDIVDATLLHALSIGAVDFLVTQDRGIHDRARRHSPDLGRRVLFVPDAVQLLRTTFEAVAAPIRYVEEVSAHTIPLGDPIFESLREDYPGFDDWWREKCIAKRRPCWVVYDGGVAGLIVRKDETAADTDAATPANKILKICTFKVRPESRGTKLGELLLKKVFWFAQVNRYDLAYLTTYPGQVALIDLLEYYGFKNTRTQSNGELIFEREFSSALLVPREDDDLFALARTNYPRFSAPAGIEAFGIPIQEGYHDVLFPDLRRPVQFELFGEDGAIGPRRPGNTIRKVYLCRAPSNLGPAGSLLFFYKGKSRLEPSQAITAVGVLEDVTLARSAKELAQLTGGRSVYSEVDLQRWNASPRRPVKVINFLLNGYLDPPIGCHELREKLIFGAHPPQSIFRIAPRGLAELLPCLRFGFQL